MQPLHPLQCYGMCCLPGCMCEQPHWRSQGRCGLWHEPVFCIVGAICKTKRHAAGTTSIHTISHTHTCTDWGKRSSGNCKQMHADVDGGSRLAMCCAKQTTCSAHHISLVSDCSIMLNGYGYVLFFLVCIQGVCKTIYGFHVKVPSTKTPLKKHPRKGMLCVQ